MLREDGKACLSLGYQIIQRVLESAFYKKKRDFIHLELKETTLQSLLVHHPVIVLLCLQDACIHFTRQDTKIFQNQFAIQFSALESTESERSRFSKRHLPEL